MIALKAGAAYFAVVYAVGFALGAARVMLVAPALGAVAATLLEMPLILVTAWISCGWALRRWAVPRSLQSRLLMGSWAFALLLTAEIILGLYAFGRTAAEQAAALSAPAGLLGLAAQTAFASFPLLRRWS